MPISAWSHSRLSVFEQCPLRAKLAYLDKVGEPVRPPLPNGQEYPNDRGERIHQLAENYVRGNLRKLPVELRPFQPELEELAALHKRKKVEMEQMWCFDRDWKRLPDGFQPTTWVRIKLDVIAWLSSSSAVVVDYKTGKRHGNEVKHGEQLQLYQLASFLRFPKLEEVVAEIWYLDQNELVSMSYTRSQGLRFLANFDRRGETLTTETEFKAKPNIFSCGYCPFKSGTLGRTSIQGTGHCDRNP